MYVCEYRELDRERERERERDDIYISTCIYTDMYIHYIYLSMYTHTQVYIRSAAPDLAKGISECIYVYT